MFGVTVMCSLVLSLVPSDFSLIRLPARPVPDRTLNRLLAEVAHYRSRGFRDDNPSYLAAKRALEAYRRKK